MKISRKALKTFILGAALLISVAAHGQGRVDHANATAASQVTPSVLLKMKDGSSLQVDEAWESEQGIWYRLGGMNHLITRERVKKIERGTIKPKADPQIAKVVAADEQATNPDDAQEGSAVDGPVWIHLVGGARVEADSVTESKAGAWYRRGSLAIFVERARIDHIEREEVGTLAEDASKRARGWTTGHSKIDSFIKQSGAKYGVDPYLIFCVMEQESHFNARALSPKGARGLMQLMPGTSARLGVRRPSDPAQNIAGGTRYLKLLLQQFHGRIDLVLAGYNAGEGAVMKFGGRVPPYRETRAYVRRISFRYRRAKAPVPKSEVATLGAGQ